MRQGWFVFASLHPPFRDERRDLHSRIIASEQINEADTCTAASACGDVNDAVWRTVVFSSNGARRDARNSAATVGS
jgi:hypothetical protein